MTDDRRARRLLISLQDDVLGDAPLAGSLRKCLIIGGKLGSTALRDWATAELRGYENDAVPEYRKVSAVICADAHMGNAIVRSQRIPVSLLPDFAQEAIKEQVNLGSPIGEIEAMIDNARGKEDSNVHLSLPMAMELAGLIDRDSGNPFQQITNLYWNLSVVSLQRVVDQVRTTLTELVAELLAGTPEDQDPSRDVVDQAVSVAVHGNKARVVVTTAQSSGSGSARAGADDDGAKSSWWTATRIAGAVVIGLVSIAGTVFALMQAQGWSF